MSDLITEVRDHICRDFHQHWELNDLAHRQDHFEAVFQTALYIKEKLGIRAYSDKEILFCAYFHDLFAWTRINHHELAHAYVLGNDHPLFVNYLDNPRERMVVALACREHRASFEGQFTTQLSELINSADRGMPAPAEVGLARVYKHRLTTMPDASEDERMAAAIAFLKKKSGSKGYARYPDMYRQLFGKELAEQQAEIDNLRV